MTHRKLSAPISKAHRIAVSAIAATLLSATGFSVETALAQQPPPAAPPRPPRPATPPRPAAPAAPRPAAPPGPAAQKPPAAPGPPPQAAAHGAPEHPQLIYSPWDTFCG